MHFCQHWQYWGFKNITSMRRSVNYLVRLSSDATQIPQQHKAFREKSMLHPFNACYECAIKFVIK